MIRAVEYGDIPECVNVIRKSFQTVADEFGINIENAPRFTAFATTEERLFWHFEQEHRPMFVFCNDDKIVGYYSLYERDTESCELSNLAVLYEYRHNGIGKQLLDHAIETSKNHGYRVLNFSIVEENAVLKKWYEKNGAVSLYRNKFDFFPFNCGYMEIKL